MTRPESRFTQRNAFCPSRSRKAPSARESATHQAADPRNTPATRATADRPEAPAARPRPANTPRNEKIVAGFAGVRRRNEPQARAGPPTPSPAPPRTALATDTRALRYTTDAPPIRRDQPARP